MITFPLHKEGSPPAIALEPSEGALVLPGGSSVMRVCLWLLGIMGVCGLCVCLMLPTVRMSPKGARRTQCANNLKQIGLALHNYHDVNGHFPPAYTVDEEGKPLHSWRVLILPFMEQNNLYQKIRLDEPWDSPHNLAVTDVTLDVYRCPSNPIEGPYTDYFVINTPDGIFDGANRVEFPEITDGSENTVLVVENSQQMIRWNEPRDLSLGAKNPTNSYHPSGSHAFFADGHIAFLFETIDLQTFRNLVTKSDGNPVEIP